MPQLNGYIGRSPGDSAVTKARQVFNVTGSTSTFTFASGYDVGYFEVFINGVKLVVNSDYTAGNGTTFTLTSAAASGDVIEAIAYKAFNVSNITEFDTASGDFNVTDDLTVGGDITFGGTLTGDGSGLTGLGTASVRTSDLGVVGVSTFNTGSTGITTIDSSGIQVTGVVTATSFVGDGSELTGVISGVELQSGGNSVGSAVTAINFSGFSSVTAPTAGLSTVTINQNLTIGVRTGAAVTFSITGSTFNVSGRSGNVVIDV